MYDTGMQLQFICFDLFRKHFSSPSLLGLYFRLKWITTHQRRLFGSIFIGKRNTHIDYASALGNRSRFILQLNRKLPAAFQIYIKRVFVLISFVSLSVCFLLWNSFCFWVELIKVMHFSCRRRKTCQINCVLYGDQSNYSKQNETSLQKCIRSILGSNQQKFNANNEPKPTHKWEMWIFFLQSNWRVGAGNYWQL